MMQIPRNYFDDEPIGCFLEVNLDYPDGLHDLHNDYPVAAEKVKIKECSLNVNYKS